MPNTFVVRVPPSSQFSVAAAWAALAEAAPWISLRPMAKNGTTLSVTAATSAVGSPPGQLSVIAMPAAFGTNTLGEEIVRLEADGSQTIVADRNTNTVPVNAGASIAGFTVDADPLINDWGAGTYIMRIYRGAELIAQAQFTLTT